MQEIQNLAGRLLNTPLLIEPRHARGLLTSFSKELGIAKLSDADGVADLGEKPRVSAGLLDGVGDRRRPYRVTNGVARIPVNGSLYHKWGWIGSYSAGYDAILHWVNLALEDPAVKGLMFDFDSPGGEVAGCFDCADKLASLRGSKPFWGLCNDMNASAAFALASAMDRRLITQTGLAGSVGVVMAHFSYEKQLEERGIEVTLIHAGDRKVDGNRYENLPKGVLESFQQETSQLRDQFAGIVSRNIGMKVEDILATEAATYRGQDAIDVGFADELVNGNEAIQLFSENLSSQGRTISLGATMSNDNGQADTAAGAEEKTVTAEGNGQEQAGTQAGSGVDSAQAERDRIQGILGHANAEGRGKLANHLAFNTSMSLEDAADMLAAAEQEVSDSIQSETALDAVMDQAGNPSVGADSGAGDVSDSDRIVASFSKATGRK